MAISSSSYTHLFSSSTQQPLYCSPSSVFISCQPRRWRRAEGIRVGIIGGISSGIATFSSKGIGAWKESCKSSSITVAPSAVGRDDPFYLLGDDYEGPIKLQGREIEIDPFAIPNASPAQIVASIFLTGAIVFLSYRALRKRATRSKEMQFRSSGVSTSKSIQEEARKTVIDNLIKAPEVPTPPQSAAQAAFGAIVAGFIAFGLWKFTTSVEAGFNVKAVSQDYSIRNLTITVRTIITGLCYLATFVFAANAVGLTLYSFQLLLGIGDSDPAPGSESLKKEKSREEEIETEDLSEK